MLSIHLVGEFNNLANRVPTIMVVQPPCHPVFMIRMVNNHDTNSCTVQPHPNFTRCILTCRKCNATTIRPIGENGVACYLIRHSLAQTEQHADSVIIPLDHKLVPTSIRMRFTGTPIVGCDETNKRNTAFGRRISKFHGEWCDVRDVT
jgi:hypothetical protein